MILMEKIYLLGMLFLILSSRAAWHTAHGEQKLTTEQSSQGSSGRAYFSRRALRLSVSGITARGFLPARK